MVPHYFNHRAVLLIAKLKGQEYIDVYQCGAAINNMFHPYYFS